jgi:F420-dependent oxidoreductase-like protein
LKLGLQIPYFTWPGGPAQLGSKLADISRTADDAGYDSIWVMDHYFQIPPVGPADLDMLEAYTTLGFIAAHTKRARLGTLVTGVTYRHPGVLIKQVTTLAVLSGGRAYLGIGAAWFEQEHAGLGVPFPPLKERFERLEDALRIAKQMWTGEDAGSFSGKHYELAQTLNVPHALSTPHPPILIGGSGERKTLRLVAKYADACNVFAPSPAEVKHKFDVLRSHCEREHRNYDDIEKTIILRMNVGREGERAAELLEQLASYADVGVQTVLGALMGVEDIKPIEVMGEKVIPEAANL